MPRTVTFALNGVSFEWDPEKAARNETRHGVPFERACEVFFDPFVRSMDAIRSEDELRDAAMGCSLSDELLVVVLVIRLEVVIRLISARRATPEERRIYEQD
jgi:uncharacterized DUF497 family protein